jgi:hypothetical protein
MEKKIEKKPAAKADEVRDFSKGRLELVKIGSVTFGRAVLEPGWKWSESVKQIAGTESCMAPHTQYHVSGTLHVKMDDGSEEEFGPGDFGFIPPGHDAWVVGDEPVVVIDVAGMKEYAREALEKRAV